MTLREELISEIPIKDRILLLPHCLDNVQKELIYNYAAQKGYTKICIAGGGSQAFNYVVKHKSKVIIAVACGNELAEGGNRIESTFELMEMPYLIGIPLKINGCVNTNVDIQEVYRVLSLGVK